LRMIEKTENEVSIKLAENEIMPGQEIHGTINISYPNRFDSVVINSQIVDSRDIFNYTSINGKKINYQYARLSIFKADLRDSRKLEFTAVTSHKPEDGYSNAKFRVAIVQEHKEVASALVFVKILG
jgi:hypothetical protein